MGIVKIVHCRIENMMAHIMTNKLLGVKFELFRERIYVVPIEETTKKREC